MEILHRKGLLVEIWTKPVREVEYKKQFARIIKLLRSNPKGMTITEISQELDLNRNACAKYLDILRVLGQTEMKVFGTAKVYFQSDRIPISSFINLTSEGIILIDNDYVINRVNNKFLELTDCKRNDLLVKKITEVKLPIINKLDIYDELAEALSGERIETERHIKVKGELRFFRVNFIPMAFDDAKPGIFLILREITERKIAEISLKKSEEQYRLILNSMGDAMHVVNRNLEIIYANTALGDWIDKFGIQPIEYHKTIFEIFPFLPKKVKKEYEYVFEHNETLITVEKTELKGEFIYTETRKIPICLGDEVVQILTILHDMTKEKKIEKKLRQIEHRYNAIFNRSMYAVYVHDFSGNFLDANARALELTGFSKEDIKHLNIRDLIVEEQLPKAINTLKKIIKTRKSIRNLFKLRKKDGNYIKVDIEETLICDEKKPYAILGIARLIENKK
jgi:PAS domain S-box-containing protein